MVGPVTSVKRNVIVAAADRLFSASSTQTPCFPVRDLIDRHDIDAAYDIQSWNIGAQLKNGRTVAGRKIGLTSRAVQNHLGAGSPDFGVLLDNFDVSSDAVIDSGRLLQPRIEPEIALILAADICEPICAEQAREFVSEVCAAFEILDSRIKEWDISLADTVADNASAGLYVLGESVRTKDAPGLTDVTVTMTEGGRRIPDGEASDAFGSLWEALAWLANTSVEYGLPLRAGEVVLTGNLGPVVAVKPGSTYAASISGIGEVTAEFSA